MMDKIINWVTLGPLKGSRTKLGVLVAAVVVVVEHFGLIAPGLVSTNPLAVKLFSLLESYFLIEHFERK